MAVDCYMWTPSQKSGGTPRASTINRFINLGVENERADAGRDGQTCLARPNFSGANGDREHIVSLLS